MLADDITVQQLADYLKANGTRIALAIRADFTHSSHSAIAAAQQADVYLASALISPSGWQTCDNSGGWNAAGELTVKANGTQPSLVLCRINYGAISGSVEVMTYPHY